MNALLSPASYRVSDSHAIDPPRVDPDPAERHFDTAFDRLVADRDQFASFVEEQDPRSLVSAFQLFHANGLPKMDKSVRSDRLCDVYEASFGGVLAAYRGWLERNGKLERKAREVMEAEAEEARQDAADAAAEG